MIGLITRSLCSATAASRADERPYQVASSVRTSSSTLLSTRISGTSASAAPRQGQDLVGAQTDRHLTLARDAHRRLLPVRILPVRVYMSRPESVRRPRVEAESWRGPAGAPELADVLASDGHADPLCHRKSGS